MKVGQEDEEVGEEGRSREVSVMRYKNSYKEEVKEIRRIKVWKWNRIL